MMAQLLFISGMIATFVVLLGWLLIGGMHESAHPEGERAQFVLLVEGWNFKPGLLRDKPIPHAYVRIGFVDYDFAWGVTWGWELVVEPPYAMFAHRHGGTLSLRLPRNWPRLTLSRW